MSHYVQEQPYLVQLIVSAIWAPLLAGVIGAPFVLRNELGRRAEHRRRAELSEFERRAEYRKSVERWRQS
jgi:hypothetical protein